MDPIRPPGSGGDPGNGGRANGDDQDEPPDKDPPEPWPEPNITYYRPDFQLFYGSEDGLPLEPSWNGTPELGERWYYLQGIHHADVNGDGHSDIVLASTSAPHIQVYHGSESGMPLEPDMTVTFNTQFSYGWRLHAPVDINGDEYDDLIIDYGQTEGLFDFVQYLYVLPGSELGIPTKPADEYRLVLEDMSSDHYPQVVMTDINGDGLDDAFIYAYLQIQTPNTARIRLQVHFNSGEIPEDPSWQYQYRTDWTVPQLGLADRGDFDNDGYEDVVIPAPGEWIWWDDGQSEYSLGHVIIVNAGGIMDLMRPLTLREGPDLYAGYKAYDFRVNVNPTGLAILPTSVQLTLDPGGANVILEAGLQAGGSYIEKVTDPDNLVTLSSDLTDIIHDSDNNTIWVHFRVLFSWSWPHEDLCDVKVGTILNDITTPFLARDLFYVENDLDLSGDLTASGALQGDLEKGDWVMSGEDVHVAGPVVVYEGTVDVYPPSGVCTVVLQDNDGSFSTADHVAGQTIGLTLGVDDATDAEETLTMTLQDLPGLATVVSQPQFPIRVDGDMPTFTNVIPGPDDWHSSSQVLTGITADDGQTAGVLASTLEYSYSIDDGTTWTDWTTNNLEVTGNDL
ncbi:MAG: VCBS repeat-containing protein, partial [Candidatus Thermoplasmatota archaeon]|nr:VCBS repeat-containing protein [Candidatus Thermoplasmatota archaeon]